MTSKEKTWIGLGAPLVIGAWFAREPLRQTITESATLANNAPSPDLVVDMIEQSQDPVGALIAAWRSGKIIHRQMAIRSLPRRFSKGQPWPEGLEEIALEAALDPDLNTREAALAILRERNHPNLAPLLAAQLNDADPEIRALGLSHLKSTPPEQGIPLASALLRDSDVAVAGRAVKLLESWAKQSFGVKLSDTVRTAATASRPPEYKPEAEARVRAAAQRAEAWQIEHQSQSKLPGLKPLPPTPSPVPLPAPNFELPTLEGQRLNIADFRGKVVLLNFWTTWCAACLAEIPTLVALRQKHGEDLVLLGVSLDNIPDDHGHSGGHSHGEHLEETQTALEGHDHEASRGALDSVRAKVSRVAKARGINYPILLDEKGQAMGLYNGGELPATVIIDAQGFIRRRFVGGRPLAVFDAMVEEAARPPRISDSYPGRTESTAPRSAPELQKTQQQDVYKRSRHSSR